MAEKAKIKMVASLAGDSFAYAPDQELTVGVDVEKRMAIALMTDPPEEPRAVPVNEAARKLIGAPEPADDEEESEVQKPEQHGSTEGQMETAEHPQAETRETATDKRTTRGRGGKKKAEAEPEPDPQPPAAAASNDPPDPDPWTE